VTHDTTRELELLQEATQRLVRTVDGFADGDWSRPSGLPGWTRSHVVAHLALNSEGLAGALTGIVDDEQDAVPMYASDEARDADIDELAARLPSELRARLMAGSTLFADAAAAVPDDAWSTRIERTPGGRTFAAAATTGMRLREVEVHHVDLDASYHHRDWTPEFCTLLLDAMVKRAVGSEPFQVAPRDLDGVWAFGEGGPTVSGTAADLGWWLTGRGDGRGLTSDSGVLPRIEGW
jgi:maleylpyruvate isomerase